MSATLYRSGSAWIIRALAWHSFKTAKEARLWAAENRLELKRAKHLDGPETLCADIRAHLGMHGPFPPDLTD
jgi:hypothetical protein